MIDLSIYLHQMPVHRIYYIYQYFVALNIIDTNIIIDIDIYSDIINTIMIDLILNIYIYSLISYFVAGIEYKYMTIL